MYTEKALENLMKAVHSADPHDIQTAMDEAKDALGYDPNKLDRNWAVSLQIDFFTSSAEEAVREFIAMTGVSSTEWVYSVKDEDNNEIAIDSYNMSRYVV